MLYKLLRCFVLAFAIVGVYFTVEIVITPLIAIHGVSGSAWFINKNGQIVTAYHVVNHNSHFFISYKGELVRATVIGVDKDNDIAVLGTGLKNTSYLPLETSYKDGEQAQLLGYPVPNTMGYNLKNKPAILKKSWSLSDTVNYVGVSCHGNSGGPIVGETGVVGIITHGITFSNPLGNCSNNGYGPTTSDIIILGKKLGIDMSQKSMVDLHHITDNQVVIIYAY
jgi:hypothetical protein